MRKETFLSAHINANDECCWITRNPGVTLRSTQCHHFVRTSDDGRVCSIIHDLRDSQYAAVPDPPISLGGRIPNLQMHGLYPAH